MSDPILQQMSIFDDVLPRYRITKPIRLIEFFAGIGSQAKALEILGVQFEHYRTCEWAYNSYCAYNSIHFKDTTDYSANLTKEQLIEKVKGTSINYNEPLTTEQLNKKPLEWLKNAYNNIIATHNLVNIMNVKGSDLNVVETDKYDYVLTYSFPCQDLSLAGLRKGMSVSQADGGTRSGLLWEVERILAECKELHQLPQILIMENVPEVCGTKNVRDFEKWQTRLQEFGYTNYCEILNGKDYGIPQNRRRCFMVSILGDNNYTFPKKIPLKIRLKNLLEKVVDEKYYLSQKMLNYCMADNTGTYKRKEAFETCLKNTNVKGVANSLTTKMGRGELDNYIDTDLKLVGTLDIKGNDSIKRVYDADGSCPTITTCDGGNRQPKIAEFNNKALNETLEQNEIKDGDGIDISSRMESHRGTVQKGSSQTITCQGGNNVGVCVNDRVENQIVKDGIAHTVLTNGNFTGLGVNLIKPETNLRIRKLTPTECMKLMGFTKTDTKCCYDIGLNDGSIYHVAGDSIITCVLVAIFSNLVNDLNTHETIINNYVEKELLK